MKYRYMANFNIYNAAGNAYRNTRTLDYIKGIGSMGVIGASLGALPNIKWDKGAFHTIEDYSEEDKNKYIKGAATGLGIGAGIGALGTYISRKRLYGH